MRKQVAVAAGVIRAPDGRILLGQRAPGTFYPGYWEFPGGKVESGESPADALVRELDEELGLQVTRLHPWLMREFEYEHAHVRLYFFVVDRWQGEPQAIVHSALAWQSPLAPEVSPMLPANGPILKALQLPTRMGVTRASLLGSAEAQIAATRAAVTQGLGLIQVREAAADGMGAPAWFARLRHAVDEAAVAAQRPKPLLVVNQASDLSLPVGADGLHLAARHLMQLQARPSGLNWLGASCHDRAQLEHAAAIGVDYAVLGSVQETPSHPGQPGLGWPTFAECVRDLPMPVFAIGGLSWADELQAWQAGAHGVAAIRAAWDACA